MKKIYSPYIYIHSMLLPKYIYPIYFIWCDCDTSAANIFRQDDILKIYLGNWKYIWAVWLWHFSWKYIWARWHTKNIFGPCDCDISAENIFGQANALKIYLGKKTHWKYIWATLKLQNIFQVSIVMKIYLGKKGNI